MLPNYEASDSIVFGYVDIVWLDVWVAEDGEGKLRYPRYKM